ncbi:MAG TPA: adenosine kinase [Dehalococcoidia bacterium]|nr:adenosine kinase [Dehalococcoidia bacterium]
MSEAQYDVTAIGNAIVDVLTQASDKLLEQQQLPKGTMSLIDEGAANRLYGLMGAGIEASGGSVANTAAGIAGLGGRTAFIGKVADDELGRVFQHDIRAVGVKFETPALKPPPSTARSLIFVTPDAQRTMETFLGACTMLTPDDVDDALIAASAVVYLEGYLWDAPGGRDAFLKAARIAAREGRKVAFTLSDPFCVDRHREAFLDFVRDHVDILFANEHEIMSLYQVDEFDAAMHSIGQHVEIAALTRSEKGSVVVNRHEVHVIDAEPGVKVVDTTGAGDAYAAGFLYAYTHAKDLHTCARLGGILAAEVISHYGPRAETDLKQLAAKL